MNSRNARVLEWVINKVATEYRDDVCLLVVYGSHINGTEGPLSDVDFYYVPASDRAGELCRTFIIEGIGYDLWPVSWERLERLSMVNEPLLPLLGDGEIAYCRSQEDRARFEGLQATLRRNVADGSYMSERSVEALSRAAAAARPMRAATGLGGCRLHAGRLLLELADALAYQNRAYFHQGLKGQFRDLSIMPHKPDGFLEGYLAVIRSNAVDRIVAGCERLLTRSARLFAPGGDIPAPAVAAPAPSAETGPVNYASLAEGYGELVSSFNKTCAACDDGDAYLAFISAVCLQQTLNEEFAGAQLEILAAYDAADLPAFRQSVEAADAALVAYIERGATIARYSSVDEFLRSNP